MVWFRIDNDLPLNPKVVEAGNSAMGLWLRARAWTVTNRTKVIPARIAHRLGAKQLCRQLIRAGLFTETPDGYTVHDSPSTRLRVISGGAS